MESTLTRDHHGEHHHDDAPILFSVIGEFDAPGDLIRAAERARAEGFTQMDAYSPFPIHGLSDAMGFHDVKLPWSIAIMGGVGAVAGLGLQYWTAVIDYPMNVGGRPLFSWPSFIPVTYECTILFAALTAVFGMLAFNGLPKPYHPVFNAPNFLRASQDKFFLSLEADSKFDVEKAEAFLKSIGAKNVSQVYADEAGKWSG